MPYNITELRVKASNLGGATEGRDEKVPGRDKLSQKWSSRSTLRIKAILGLNMSQYVLDNPGCSAYR